MAQRAIVTRRENDENGEPGLARIITDSGRADGSTVKFYFDGRRTLAHPRRKIVFTNELARIAWPHVGDRIVVRLDSSKRRATAWTHAPIWDGLMRDLDRTSSQNRYRIVQRVVPVPVRVDRVIWEGIGLNALTRAFPWQYDPEDDVIGRHGTSTSYVHTWVERLMNGVWRHCCDPRVDPTELAVDHRYHEFEDLDLLEVPA